MCTATGIKADPAKAALEAQAEARAKTDAERQAEAEAAARAVDKAQQLDRRAAAASQGNTFGSFASGGARNFFGW
jgi:ribosomal protein L9